MQLRRDDNSFSGTDYALTIGTFMPQGNLSILGTSPAIGFLIGGRQNKWTFDADFFINFPLTKTGTYSVSNNDSMTPSNTYLGFYIGLDANYALYHKNNSELNILGAIALQGIQVLNGKNGTANLTLVSANPNLGLGYKLYLIHRVKSNNTDNTYSVRNSYIGIQAKYNFLFFNNNPGTSLSGNAYTITLIYGGTSKKRKYIN